MAVDLNVEAWNAAEADFMLAATAAAIRLNGVPSMTLVGIAIRSYLEALPPTVAGEVVARPDWSKAMIDAAVSEINRRLAIDNPDSDTAIVHRSDVRLAVDAALAVSPSDASNLTVGVKPLEWVDTPDRQHPEWIAMTNIGIDFRVFEAWWGTQDKWGYVFDGSFYHTPDAAKAAGQADFDARIRSNCSAVPKPQATPGREAVEGEAIPKAMRIADKIRAVAAQLETLPRNVLPTPSPEYFADDLRSLAEAVKTLAAPSQPSRNEVIEAFNWALDEVDVLSNKISGFAYPQGMAFVDRRGQLDNYRKAVDARRAAIRSIKEGEAK